MTAPGEPQCPCLNPSVTLTIRNKTEQGLLFPQGKPWSLSSGHEGSAQVEGSGDWERRGKG